MATETVVAEKDLVLTPPDPVPVVAPEKAAGLVPVEDTKKSELDKRVDGFIDEKSPRALIAGLSSDVEVDLQGPCK